MRDIMKYDKFKYILNVIKNYNEKIERISDFMEKEVCTDSYCMINVGGELINTLTSMLADEFDCWYYISSGNINLETLVEGKIPGVNREIEPPVNEWWDSSKGRWENDIEYWLYEDNKKIIIEGKEVPIETEGQFYDYLVTQLLDKNKKEL